MKNTFKILILFLCYNTFAQQKTIEYQDEFGQKCDAKISFFRLTKTIINDCIITTELYDNKEKEIINTKNTYTKPLN